MSEKAPIFEETLRNYLAQVAQIDLTGIAQTLAISVEQGEAVIPFLGKTYRVSPSGVLDESGRAPIHAVSIVLCRYLILAPPPFPSWSGFQSTPATSDAAAAVPSSIKALPKCKLPIWL